MALTKRELEVQNFFPRDESKTRDAARDVHLDWLQDFAVDLKTSKKPMSFAF